MNDQPHHPSESRRSDPQASDQLSKALDQLLYKLDKSKSELLKAEVLATIDRAVSW